MLLGEAILKRLSRKPELGDFEEDSGHKELGEELSLLKREFGDLSSYIKGKRVVDFGCGEGRQAVALAMEEECYVTGIDNNTNALDKAKELACERGIDKERVKFKDRISNDMRGAFDLVISQNAMEHFPDPVAILNEMKSLIHKDGKILITFSPPWFAPYGSHMHFFCKIPWVNILFSEKTVMQVRANYRSDGAMRYEDVESGLNKMTVSKFEKIIYRSRLQISCNKYSCVKTQNWLSGIPLIRELFINRVTSVLTPTEPL